MYAKSRAAKALAAENEKARRASAAENENGVACISLTRATRFRAGWLKAEVGGQRPSQPGRYARLARFSASVALLMDFRVLVGRPRRRVGRGLDGGAVERYICDETNTRWKELLRATHGDLQSGARRRERAGTDGVRRGTDNDFRHAGGAGTTRYGCRRRVARRR